MLVQNGFDDVKPETHAVLILIAGLVAFVEALKQQRDLLRRNGVALVADRDERLAVGNGETEVERGAGTGKFRRVFQKIVNDLRDEVVVAHDGDARVRNVRLHVKPAVRDLLFQRDQHAAHAFAHVKRRALHVARLELRDLKHTAHQTRKAARLVRDDAKVRLFLARRDRAVQNAVGIAGDGRHGRFQLVGDVGDKLAALALRLLERVRHIVEGNRKLRDLRHALVVVHPHVKVAVGKAARRRRHLADGLGLAHTRPCAHHEGQQQHRNRRHEEHAEKRAPHGRQRVRLRHRQHGADDLSARVDRNAHDKILFLIDASERRPLRIGALR